MTDDTTHLRVNLRFGNRTDPQLRRELAALTPYARAKLIRRLMQEGWRARLGEPPPNPRSNENLMKSRESQAMPPAPPQLSDDILALVGRSVRV